LILALVWVGCSNCKKQSTDKPGPGMGKENKPAPVAKSFKVATLTWVGYAPIHLALKKGFFKGIDVELAVIEDTAARRAALTSGKVQASVDIVDSFANALATGMPASVVLKLDDSMGGDGIVVKREINSVKDLRGKSVAYPQGQPSHFFLLALLKKNGMTIKDLVSKHMEADQAGVAFVSGDVDAAVTWEPWLTKASKTKHGKVLTTSRETPGLIVDVFTVRNDFLKQSPDVVEAFIKGWFEAIEYWKANKKEANEIMAKFMKVKPPEFEKMIAGIRYSDLALNQEFFKKGEKDGSKFTQLVDQASAIWVEQKVSKRLVKGESADGSSIVLSMKR